MLADFEISLHRDDHPMLTVRVVVHENLRAFRSAATQHNRRWGTKEPLAKDVIGLCQRFQLQHANGKNDPLVAVVRFVPPHLGVGIISHELTHAAVWIHEIDNEFKDTPLTCENDEEFCWILGELVQQTVKKLYEKGVYTNEE